jgi:hypothetical protein
MGDMINTYNIFVGKPERKYNLGDQGIKRNAILKWFLKKYGVRLCTGLNQLRTESSGRVVANTETHPRVSIRG